MKNLPDAVRVIVCASSLIKCTPVIALLAGFPLLNVTAFLFLDQSHTLPHYTLVSECEYNRRKHLPQTGRIVHDGYSMQENRSQKIDFERDGPTKSAWNF